MSDYAKAAADDDDDEVALLYHELKNVFKMGKRFANHLATPQLPPRTP